MKIVEDELKRLKIEVCGLSETHYEQTGYFQATEYMVYFSSFKEARSRGVAIIVAKSLVNAVSGFDTVSEQMISLRIKARSLDTNFIQVYAPTADSEDDEVEAFYRDLSDEIAKLPPKKTITFVTGDFNAKIGNTSANDYIRKR